MKRSLLPALLVCAGVLAACGTDVTGNAVTSTEQSAAATTGESADAVAVPAGLDVGTFPTALRDVPPPSSDTAWVLEGNRMGEVLIEPDQIDPRLTVGGAALRSFPVLAGAQLTDRVPDDTANAFESSNFRVGMTTTRGDTLADASVALRIGLYRFASPQDAQDAFDQVQQSQESLPAVSISSVPGVIAAEFVPGTVDSYRVEGPFVMNISGTGETTDEGADFVSRAYQLQVPAVQAFTPTPADNVGEVAPDRDGIMARTLLQDAGDDEVQASLSNNYYGLPMLLHKISDSRNGVIYEDAGVDLVGEGLTVVYRAADPAAATELVAAIRRPTPWSNPSTPVESPVNLPQANCIETAAGGFNCAVAAGRYAATTGADTLLEAQQIISAQFTILAQNP